MTFSTNAGGSCVKNPWNPAGFLRLFALLPPPICEKFVIFFVFRYTLELEYQNYGNETLKQIAIVNVKKSDGKCSSEMEEINRYAEFDKDELRKELELCDPTIIVCGYTISSLNIIMQKNIKETYNDHWFYWIEMNDHPVLVIDYYHPANHYPDLLNYYGLMNIYQCALKSVQF